MTIALAPTPPTVPQVVMDYLLDKALEAMERGDPVTLKIHGKGPLCGDRCQVHPA